MGSGSTVLIHPRWPPLALVGDPRQEHARTMPAGIHAIGLALQHMADVTDLKLDVTALGHNLLQSEIHHHGIEDERTHLEATRSGLLGDTCRSIFWASGGRLVARALSTAQNVFRCWSRPGTPWGEPEPRRC